MRYILSSIQLKTYSHKLNIYDIIHQLSFSYDCTGFVPSIFADTVYCYDRNNIIIYTIYYKHNTYYTKPFCSHIIYGHSTFISLTFSSSQEMSMLICFFFCLFHIIRRLDCPFWSYAYERNSFLHSIVKNHLQWYLKIRQPLI